MGSSVRRSIAVLAALSMVFVGLLVSGATAATTTKPYSADITPACVSPGTSVAFTITLRNKTKTQMLGSANVTAPAGFTITSATPDGTTVELRNLNTPAGGTVSRSFTATTSATVGAVNWSIIAKQANDYNGSPGNNLTLDAANSHLTSYVGTCVLAFVTQPTDAKVGANVTSVTADPAGTPVRVVVLNGPGGSQVTTSSDAVTLAITSGTGTAGAALTPSTPSANAVNGLATFGFSIGTAGFGYQVTASSSGSTSADSAAFNVADDAVLCTGHGCNGNAAKNNVTVNVTAPLAASGDLLEVALDLETLSCAGYTPLAGAPVVTFTVTGSSYRLVTIIVPAALDPRPASQDRVCYGSAKAFTDRSGLTNVNVGLLPDCKNKVDLTSPTLLPCQRPTTVDRSTGAHTVSFYAPFGSTRGRT